MNSVLSIDERMVLGLPRGPTTCDAQMPHVPRVHGEATAAMANATAQPCDGCHIIFRTRMHYPELFICFLIHEIGSEKCLTLLVNAKANVQTISLLHT